MPLAYRIAEGIVTITGDYAEPEEWATLLAAIGSDRHFARGLCFLRDLRGSEHPVSPETVIGILKVVGRFWDRLGVRRAAIVTGVAINEPAFVAHALAEDGGLPLRAFTVYEDAIGWLREP